MKKYSTKYTTFYITNVCNFNCTDCNSFNNYHFTGKYKWADYAETYKKWSEIFDVGRWEVSGGETMTSNDWIDWVKGINELWPDNEGHIQSNGSLIDKNRDKLRQLYDIQAKSNGKVRLRYSLHNLHRFDELISEVKEYLGPSWTIHTKENFEQNFLNDYNNIKAESWPSISNFNDWHNLIENIKNECRDVFNLSPETAAVTQLSQLIKRFKENFDTANMDVIEFTNHENVNVHIMFENMFYPASVRFDHDTKIFSVLNSDPDAAHYACQNKCGRRDGLDIPAFVDGKLYKCLTSRVLPDFDRQYHIQMSDSDRAVLHSYLPASIDMSDIELEDWFYNLPNKIKNCKFCPTNYSDVTNIYQSAGTKKIFIKKKSKTQN